LRIRCMEFDRLGPMGAAAGQSIILADWPALNAWLAAYPDQRD